MPLRACSNECEELRFFIPCDRILKILFWNDYFLPGNVSRNRVVAKTNFTTMGPSCIRAPNAIAQSMTKFYTGKKATESLIVAVVCLGISLYVL